MKMTCRLSFSDHLDIDCSDLGKESLADEKGVAHVHVVHLHASSFGVR